MWTKFLQIQTAGNISDATTWADVIKLKRPYLKPWHYIGESLTAKHISGLTILPKMPATLHQQHVLSPFPLTAETLKKRLRCHSYQEPNRPFHQPFQVCGNTQRSPNVHPALSQGKLTNLHIEDQARGGNEINVCFGPVFSGNNLHSVWDKYLH